MVSPVVMLSSHWHALGSLQQEEQDQKSNILWGWTVTCLPGVSSAERIWQVLFLPHLTHWTCAAEMAHRDRHGTLTLWGITKIPAHSLYSSIYPDTWNPKHSKSSKVNGSKGKRRIWENTLSKMTKILTRATEGQKKRAKSRNSNEKHIGLFWELVVESPVLHFKKYLLNLHLTFWGLSPHPSYALLG